MLGDASVPRPGSPKAMDRQFVNMIIAEVAKTSNQMNAKIRYAPVILLGLLLGGWFVFCLNGNFPVPIETWVAMSGIVIFCLGLLYGLVSGIQSIVTILSKKRRQAIGTVAPILTLLIAVVAWTIVINTTLDVVHSLQKRAEAEGTSTSSFQSQ